MDFMDKNISVFAFKIPTLNLKQDFFYTMSTLYNGICNSSHDTIIFDFKECKFINPAFISYLGGLKVYFGSKGKTIIFSTSNENKAINRFLISSGIRGYFDNNFSKGYASSNAIPFKRIDMLDESAILDYIGNITNLAPINLSERAKQQIFQNIYEIFNNAIEHSEHTEGVFSSGYWLPNKKELIFSIYDTGIGISQKIRNSYPMMSSFEAFNWAMQSGNSTKQLDLGVPRGLGLHTLKQFIFLNKGALHIYSNDIYYTYPNTGHAGVLPFSTVGTLVAIKINADYEHLYKMKGE